MKNIFIGALVVSFLNLYSSEDYLEMTKKNKAYSEPKLAHRNSEVSLDKLMFPVEKESHKQICRVRETDQKMNNSK